MNDQTKRTTETVRRRSDDIPTGGSKADSLYIPDDTDSAIAQCLISDPLMSIQDVAEHVGIVSPTASHRLKRLQKLGLVKVIILKDVQLFGFRYGCLLEVANWNTAVLDNVGDNEAVIVAFRCILNDQLNIFVAYRDFAELRERVDSILEAAGDRATCKQTLMTEPHISRLTYADMGGTARSESERTGKYSALKDPRCDHIDAEILAHLSEDARQSLRGIALRIGLSEKAVRMRLRALNEKGLTSISTVVSPSLTGYTETAICFANLKPRLRPEFLDRCEQDSRIQYVASASGEFDLYFVLIYETLADLEALRASLAPYCARLETRVISHIYASRYDMVITPK